MKLYVIRHGQSETNLNRLYTGWFDAPLTKSGENDALFARELLSGIKFDAVFSSDLSRAAKTAEIVLPDYTVTKTPLLREFDVGSLANKPIDDITEPMRAIIAENGFSHFGGEGRDEFYGRIKEFMALCESCDAKTVAAFSHNGFIRSMIDIVLGTRIQRSALICANCAVAVFEYANGKWRLHSLMNK